MYAGYEFITNSMSDRNSETVLREKESYIVETTVLKYCYILYLNKYTLVDNCFT
jgi:hypothetical protein